MTETTQQIAARGHVYVGAPDAEPFDHTTYVFNPASDPAGFKWLGDSSAENLIELKQDGGDVKFLNTWDREGVRVIRDATTLTATVNSVNTSGDLFKIAFPGGKLDAEKKTYSIPSNVGSYAASLQVIIEDGNRIGGYYFPNVDIKGGFPVLAIDKFTEIPLSCSVLSSAKTGDQAVWLIPTVRTPAG